MFQSKGQKPRSGSFAKQRIDELLLSERLNCTPQMITTLKHETIREIRKYISIEESKVSLWITGEPPALMLRIPLKRNRKKNDAETI